MQKLGTMNADFICERLFDSADTASMAFELLSIVGPSLLVGKLSERLSTAASSKAEQKQLYDRLRTLAKQKVWLPVSAERQIGEWLDRKYRGESLVLDAASLPRNQRERFAMTQGVLDGVVATLPADNPYTFTLAVTEANESNASISPGGYVYVTTGMLQDKTLDRNDIALRLSHEVAHLTRRHALKELQVKIVDAVEISKSTKPLLDFAQQPVRGAEALFGTVKATALMFQRFDQVQELEADACGTYLLVRQKDVDAKAAVKRFAATRAGNGSAKGWESSHPASEERELVMSAQLDPATRARVTQLRTSGAAVPVTAAGGRPDASRALRDEANLNTLPPNAAGVQPSSGSNFIGSLFDKLKQSIPVAASGVAPAQPRESP